MTEVLGHILVFSVIVASIGLIVATGLAGLEDTRESERFQNADRAFDVLAENMASVYERDVPSRATEIDVGDGQILYADEVDINISVEPADGGNLSSNSFSSRPVEFRVDSGRSIVFEAGAVIRDQPRGGYMVSEPPFLLSNDTIHIPIIQTIPRAERSVGGSTVLVRGVSRDRTVLETPEDYDRIWINVTSPRAEQWFDYFDAQAGIEDDDCDLIDAGGKVTCEIDAPTSETYVTFQRIRISLDT